MCLKVNIDKNITIFNGQVHKSGKLCALIDSSQPAMTILFQYSGSLAQHFTWMNFSCFDGDMHGLPIMFLNDYIP